MAGWPQYPFAKMPSWPAATKPASLSFVAWICARPLFGHGERLSARAEALAASPWSAETTSTQSRAERW